MTIGQELSLELNNWARGLPVQVSGKDQRFGVAWIIEQAGSRSQVVMGHAHDVHIWIIVNGEWRADSHADDLESLVYEWRLFLKSAERILNGQEEPPIAKAGSRPRRELWAIRDPDLTLRRVRGA